MSGCDKEILLVTNQNTEKETYYESSMGVRSMDGTKTEYQKPGLSARNRCRKGPGIYRLAAAGLAGSLLSVCAAGTVSASQIPGSAARCSAPAENGWVFKDHVRETEDDILEENSSTVSEEKWDEEKILKIWDLDPDDFPSEQEEGHPYIPDEILPFFREMTEEAVTWYAGGTPPKQDLSKYSARADAIRKAAGDLAEKNLRSESKKIKDVCRELAQSTQKTAGKDLVYTLQNGSFSIGRGTYALADGADTSRQNRNEKNTETGGGVLSLPGLNARGSGGSKSDDTTSVDMFLGRKNGSQDISSPDKEETAVKQDASQSHNAAPSSGRAVYQPSSDFPLTAPFLYDTAPASFPEQNVESMPLPPGIYPQYASETLMTEKAEQDIREEEIYGTEEKENHAVTDAEPEQEYEQEYDRDLSSDKDTDGRKVSSGKNIVPFRYPSFNVDDPSAYAEHRRTVFIGDSRTVGMEIYCGGEPDEFWSAKNSMGYSWMVSSGIPDVEYLIDQNTDVVILMGVNDLGNVNRYIDYINEKAAEWKEFGARTFFVSVTPVDDRRSPNAKNSRIESFNAYAKENLRDAYYIDAYSRIRYSFGSPDGIHFDSATYREIYRIISFYLYRGWYERDGLWFYFDHGEPYTGWHYLDMQWQYMDGYGVRWVRNGRVGDMCMVPLPDFCFLSKDSER